MRRETYRTGAFAAALFSFALLGGCDVTNPGPVQDEFLSGESLKGIGTQQGLVRGAVRNMAELVGQGSYTTALLAREIFPGGQTGSNGHDVITQGGHVLPGSNGGLFNDAVQARFIAESAVKRLKAVNASNAIMFQAHFWAGQAYRYLGEWWCDAVVTPLDPDSRVPGTFESGTKTYFDRAVANFTAALGFASTDEERYAARAGRAQARAFLGDWAGVAQDAALIPDDFELLINLDQLDVATYNKFYEAQSGVFRSYTIRFTFFDTYYAETGDPRAKWDTDPANEFATASLQGYGRVPYTRQTKYLDRNADQRLASGWEMRLLEAEAKLRAATPDVAGAMALINRVRTRNVSDVTGQPLAARTAANPVEAWSALKRERYVELWLEGHRLADERRWAASNTPGSLDTPAFETLSTLFTSNPRSYCFDIPDSERDLNPNVPPSGG
jgi:hypothetical protein